MKSWVAQLNAACLKLQCVNFLLWSSSYCILYSCWGGITKSKPYTVLNDCFLFLKLYLDILHCILHWVWLLSFLEAFECFDPDKRFSSADHGWTRFNRMRLWWFWHHQQNVFKDHLDSAVRENCSETEVGHEGALFPFFISKKITLPVFNLAYFSQQCQRNLLSWYVFEMHLITTQSPINSTAPIVHYIKWNSSYFKVL